MAMFVLGLYCHSLLTSVIKYLILPISQSTNKFVALFPEVFSNFMFGVVLVTFFDITFFYQLKFV